MYFEMARRLHLPSGAIEHSQAILLRGNAIAIDAQVYFIDGSEPVLLQAQQGNDLENWEDIGSALSLDEIEARFARITDIAAKYVRLKYTASDSAAIIAAGIETSEL
ncbi:MAG: hypothetical protein IPN34_21315 [Planctomycetes bacterium]|nr:hypothetical protein [Planctomycetota bacterium]